MTEAFGDPPSSNVIAFPLDEIESELAELRSAIGGWKPPCDKKWNELVNLAPALRIAWLTIYKSRAEIREIVRKLDDETPADLAGTMRQLATAGDYFFMLARICAAAEARFQAHGAAPADVDWREQPRKA